MWYLPKRAAPYRLILIASWGAKKQKHLKYTLFYFYLGRAGQGRAGQVRGARDEKGEKEAGSSDLWAQNVKQAAHRPAVMAV